MDGMLIGMIAIGFVMVVLRVAIVLCGLRRSAMTDVMGRPEITMVPVRVTANGRDNGREV